MRLRDANIVVTGASGGLGRSMAGAFVGEGASVVCSSRSDERLSSTVAEIVESGSPGDAIAIPADVRSWAAVQNLVQSAEEQVGAIDVFVNNAGVMQPNVIGNHVEYPVVDVPVDVWDTVIETNLRGAFLCAKAVLPGMLERGTGRLIHVSSGHGSRGRATRAPYSASKFGLEGLHDALSEELSESGVASIAFRPPDGGVFTERKHGLGRPADTFAHDSPDVVAEPAVRLAAGEGENGGRYIADETGDGFSAYGRS